MQGQLHSTALLDGPSAGEAQIFARCWSMN